jgi:hypothetical protein
MKSLTALPCCLPASPKDQQLKFRKTDFFKNPFESGNYRVEQLTIPSFGEVFSVEKGGRKTIYKSNWSDFPVQMTKSSERKRVLVN